jgi:hypothetical protein
MAQTALMETSVSAEWALAHTGDIKIVFTEYEAGAEPTGRTWSGMMTDKALFDLLLKAGVITLDCYELGTGVRNEIILKQRKLD